ncbi:hypothetical protein HPB47_009878 [Ixodes persulcatus]|uniref:Uncharacterized protein n=1 Tax=Ixodes persulcatus TaxID=34615 RepID=A0AC60P0N5_IXOPE|nr:hypothetical protein HPB47_009878 [Ixodes persulcatus]
MKRIPSIEKGATALADLRATLKLSHQGPHHKTFRGHMGTTVQACQAAAAIEAPSVQVVKGSYQNLLNSVGNVDTIFNEIRKTRGQHSNISVGCILKLSYRA